MFKRRKISGSWIWGGESDNEKEEEDPKTKSPKHDSLKKEDDKSGDLISQCDNHIYYYQNVNKKNALIFIKMVRRLDEDLQISKLRQEITEPTIHLHFNSPGGELLQGFAMASVLLRVKSRTVGYAEGMIASAITLPFVVCQKRIIQKFGYCLIKVIFPMIFMTIFMFLRKKYNYFSPASQK